MPVLLPDDLALILFRALTRVPPVSGHVIQDMLTEQGKLLHHIQGQLCTMSQNTQTTDQQFQAELSSFADDLRQQTTVTNGLKIAFATVAEQLAAAIEAAKNSGASEEELTSLRSLHAGLRDNTTTITQAITENTAAAGEPPAPPVGEGEGTAEGEGSTEGTAASTRRR